MTVGMPRYLTKFRERDLGGTVWSSFSDYLDRLDAQDWSDLLTDLLAAPTTALYEVIAPPLGTDLLEYTSRLLRQASGYTLQQCGKALDLALGRAVPGVEKGGALEPVLRGLFLTETLEEAATALTAVSSMVLNTKLPNEVRAKAALVVSDRETQLPWDDLDLRTESFLLPAVVIARTYPDPIRAIHALVEAAPPPNPEYLSFPVRTALRHVCRDANGGIKRAKELAENLPRGHWSREYVWGHTLKLKEFARLREALGLDGGAALAPATPYSDEEHFREGAPSVTESLDDIWGGTINDFIDGPAIKGAFQRLLREIQSI